MLELVVDVLSWGFLLGGGFFLIVSAIGLHRMPDVFTRMHAAGVGDTMGADLVLTGLILQAGLTLDAAKLFLILGFLFITGPVVGHATARAALQGGVKPILEEDMEARDG
jgi:multicomponent Na+:H+ antiporter subunit G